MIIIFFFLLCLKSTQCHLRKLEGFVLDGEVAEIKDFPHSAHLESYCGRKRITLCGASILNQVILLTAAHCFTDRCARHGLQRFKARFGHAKRGYGIKIGILRYIIHENYNEKKLLYDIGLALLKKPVTFGSSIARVALRNSPVRNGEMGAIAGWGLVLLNPIKKSNVLRHVNQTIVLRDQCKDHIGGRLIAEGNFCAKELLGRTILGGDSGSAFVVNRYIQVGLASFIIPRYPNISVYTDVTYFYDWIKRNTVKLYCRDDFKHKRIQG